MNWKDFNDQLRDWEIDCEFLRRQKYFLLQINIFQIVAAPSCVGERGGWKRRGESNGEVK